MFLSGLRGEPDLLGGLFGALQQPGMMSAAPEPEAKPQRRGGFLRGLAGGLDMNRFALAQAMMAGDYATAAQIMAQQRQLAGRRQAAEQAREAEGGRMEALAGMGFTKDQIAGLNADDASQLARERLQPRQFGAEGGSMYDPQTGGFTRAPARYTDQGRIIDVPSEGEPNQIYDARQNDIEWVNGPWGAFSTDRSGRPTAPGVNIQSPIGQPPAQAPTQPEQAEPAAAPTAFNADGIFQRMIGAESNGQQFDRNGRPLRSSAGAIGIAQVMPGTAPEAAALAGLPFDRNRYMNDPQYNAALGRAYFQRQLRDFGDPALAVAAYNAGPARIRNAVQRGGANWQAHIPQETRDYVQNVLGDGAGGTQFAQTGTQNMPGQGRSIQEQAAGGFVQAPQQAPAGYQWGPGGTLIPIPGGPGAQAAAQEGRQQRGEVETLVQRFEAEPQVRLFNETRTAMMQVERLANAVPDGHPERAQHDMALVFAVMRAYDPSASVREGEYATAQNAANIPDRIRNAWNSMVSGGFLSPTQRRGMVSSAYQLYLGRAQSYNDFARRMHPRLRSLGVQEPGEFIPLATGPDTDRRQRDQQRQQQSPQRAIDAGRNMVDQMLPGRRSGRTRTGNVGWEIVN